MNVMINFLTFITLEYNIKLSIMSKI